LWPTLNTPITGKIVTRWLGLGLLYAGMMLGLGVLFTGFIPDWAHTTDQLKSTSITPQNIVTAVWVSPWLEELIFRGGLLGSYCGSITQGTLWERLKRAWLPLLLISGLFTVCHSHYTTSSIALIFVMGQALLLGMARLHTGTLWAPILMHTLNNALSLYGWP
jgi:membrane protease YdiL (CAAX protease family)